MRVVAHIIVWAGYSIYGLSVLLMLLFPNPKKPQLGLFDDFKNLREVPWQFTASVTALFVIWIIARGYLSEEQEEDEQETS